MKKINILKVISFFCIGLFVCSCEDTLITTNVNENSTENALKSTGVSYRVENGRLCFQSENDLQAAHKILSEIDNEEDTYNYLKLAYNNGFISLRPPVIEANEAELAKQMDKRIEDIPKEELSAAMRKSGIINETEDKYEQIAGLIDEIEYYIGDDIFAALLNHLGEIQVGDQIYKYTDVGMFYSTDINEINKYLTSQKVSSNPLIPTDIEFKIAIMNRLNNSLNLPNTISLSGNLKYFALIEDTFEHKQFEQRSVIPNQRFFPTLGDLSGGCAHRNWNPDTCPKCRSNCKQPNCNWCNAKFAPKCVHSFAGKNCPVCKKKHCQNYKCFYCNKKYGAVPPPPPPPPVSNDPTPYLNSISDCNPRNGIFGNLFGTNKVCIDRYEKRRRVKTKAFNYNYFIVYHIGTKVKHEYRGWTGFWRTEKAPFIEMGVEYAQFTYDYSKWVGATLSNGAKAQKVSVGNNQYSIGMDGWKVTSFNNNQYPKLFQDDLVIEEFLGYKIGQIAVNISADQLNKYFWNTLWNETNDFLKSVSSSSVNIQNRTLLLKDNLFGKLRVQKVYKKSGNNLGVREKTLDFGFSVSVSANSGNDWSISVGQGNPIKLSNFKCRMYGVVRGGDGKWHGSKLAFD